ncbi:MarR family winged helix-turn-helix transcriptional regulator [Nonlabens agnitus]|uniref:HTH-type transcriptional regulator SarZ n=1 Tax=Nonlabens agnitus TaxID=870484 RepID=A0A2S9WS99_9FLAO|nr:MarR family transcriptional regulator [Nonlabens agnitus]PRP66363.1 MarR family transcriptional regulator [Nonlabens agnitus]
MTDQKPHTDALKLSNQMCFPIYSVSRLITKAYKPYLDKMGMTYPQYLVMLVLWEQDQVSVNYISEKLLLNTNTLSPLLQRIENQGWIDRNRCKDDERSVIICLSEKGKELKETAASIPNEMLELLMTENVTLSEIKHLKNILDSWMDALTSKEEHNNRKQ